jgi:hypothetical protein
MAGGLLVAAGGLALLGRLGPHSGYAGLVLPAELLVGTGMGALFPPAFSLAISAVTPRDAGVASAVVTTATQVGSSIGTAVLNTVAVSATAAYVAAHAARPGVGTEALVHGYGAATGWSALVLAAVAVAVLVVVDAPRPTPR